MKNLVNHFLSSLKKIAKRKQLLIRAIRTTDKNHRAIIFKTYKFLRQNGTAKTADDYYFQSLNSLVSITRYIKMGYGDGLEKVKNHKKSDTVYILGSGPSINEISEKQWPLIKKHDSWGFNWWFLHDHIPTVHFFQSTKRQDYDKLMAQLFLYKSEDYNKNECVTIARGDGVNYKLFLNSNIANALMSASNKLHFLPEHFIYGGNTIAPKLLINAMYKIGCFNTLYNKSIPKFRSSVCLFISLALMAGYKEIVLCGIDMNDNVHYFDNDTYTHKYPELQKLIDYNKSFGKSHPHINIGTYSVKEYIYALNDLAKEFFCSEIFVSSNTSSLYPKLNKYKHL